MSRYSRRDFLKASAAAGAAATLSNVPLSAETRKATDLVTLGKSNVKVTRLAFGTGTMSGAVQRNLGQDSFNRLVRHAYDHGIRFFETSDTYGDMHTMLGIALKGIPRDTYQLMTKVTTEDPVDPQAHIDELRKQINSEYFDIALLHWQHIGDWPDVTTRWQDGIVKAQERKAVIARGASVHGSARASPRARLPLARSRHDPRQPQRHSHGYAYRRRPWPRQRSGSRRAYPSGPRRRYGRGQHEARR